MNKRLNFFAFLASIMISTSIITIPIHADYWSDNGWQVGTAADAGLTDAEQKELSQRENSILNKLNLNGDKLHDMELIYNYVKNNCSYDQNQTHPPITSTSLGAARGNAICNGYSALLCNLFRRIGVDCRQYSSATVNHAWNVIYMNGKEYVCDVTWDSCLNKNKSNEYFLILPKNYENMSAKDITDTTAVFKGKTQYKIKNINSDGKIKLTSSDMTLDLFDQNKWAWQDASKGFKNLIDEPNFPDEWVFLNANHLIKNQDYTIKFDETNIIITGIGNYYGSVVWNEDTGKISEDRENLTVAYVGKGEMYRLYNPNSGEHFYTANTKERDHLINIGWNYEGVGWEAPKKSNTPVYRLYNANGGEHHYTMNAKERDGLVKAGWKYEGIGWYSDDNKSVPLLREYNPNKYSCNHNYTTSEKEHNHLVSIGWRDEGIAWYGTR